MAGLIPVAEALERALALVAPLGAEDVPLRGAGGRVLARPVVARHPQPPFDASVMDGYAVRAEEARPGATFRVVGEAAAGGGPAPAVGPGQAVRILTGAPMPEGASRVVIQEDVAREGDAITLSDALDPGPYVRPAGGDFAPGDALPPGVLTPGRVALAAAMGAAVLPCARRPAVAILATGDELVPPGEPLGPGRIHASNGYGLAAMVEAAGGEARLLPIARDDERSLREVIGLAEGADVVVTMGGASVGDRDLVGPVLEAMGMRRSFWRVAMRPGKPLMAGRLGGAAVLGLPGNPVSSLVCGRVFLVPMLRRMLGLDPAEAPLPMRLASPLGANGPRAHYMRAAREGGAVRVAERQDSALLSVLAASDALVVRPPGDPARREGDFVDVLPLAV